MKPELTDVLSFGCEIVVGWKEIPAFAFAFALCNKYGQIVFNIYVKHFYVEDFMTEVTGITRNHLRSGKRFRQLHPEVADIIRGRILVGHNLNDNLSDFGWGHPEEDRRDISEYFATKRGVPSLKTLARKYGWRIHYGYNNAVEDARAAMFIYNKFEDEWEDYMSQYYNTD